MGGFRVYIVLFLLALWAGRSYNTVVTLNFTPRKARRLMPEKRLTQLLEQLHQELDQVEAVDEKGRELLQALNADIESLLERTEGGRSNEPMLKRLQATINHFEDSHPALTTALAQMLNALNNAGI